MTYPSVYFVHGQNTHRNEGQEFRAAGEKFDLLLAVLEGFGRGGQCAQRFSIWQVEGMPLGDPFTLSDQEKLKMLFKTEPLGGRKPSQLLATMRAYCPAGTWSRCPCVNTYMFRQRLPCTLRTRRADKLWGSSTRSCPMTWWPTWSSPPSR
jgi:hypothetical protein